MYRGQRLARMLEAKMESDEYLFSVDRLSWYDIDRSRLSEDVCTKFHLSEYDSETETFLDASREVSNNICLQLYYSLATSLLSLVLTKTSINGLVGRGGMFVFSRNQFKNFLQLPDEWSPIEKKVLDLGAGDGGVSKVMSHFYKDVYATETSTVMQWRLKQHGFTILDIEEWPKTGPYHLIAALNLLDRHYAPKKLLKELHELASRSNCLVLLALVLPISQYVEFNLKNASETCPDHLLPILGATFEDQVNSIIHDVFEPNNFEVVRWTRLPYLCEGDSVRAYYKLDDAVFLLKPKKTTDSSHASDEKSVKHEEL